MTTGNLTMGPLFYGSGVTSGVKYYQKFWGGADRGYTLRRYRPVKEYYTDSAGKQRYTIRRVDAYPGPVPDTPHAYHMQCQEYESSPGTYRYWTSGPSGGHWVYSPWSPLQAGVGFQHSHVIWDSNDDIALVNKLRARMLGSDFDPGIFMAEFPKACKLITGAATRLVSAYSRARSGRFVSAVRVLLDGSDDLKGVLRATRRQQRAFELEAVRQAKRMGLRPSSPLIDGDVKIPAKRLDKLRQKHARLVQEQREAEATSPLQLRLSRFWLELQYGWRPLVQDLQGGVEAAAHALETPRKRRYTASKRKVSSAAWCRLSGGGVYLYPQKQNIFARKRITAYVTEADVPTMGQMVDLTTIAWEVTPFSFLSDWVVPFGAFLSARAFAARTTGTFIYSTKYVVEGSDFLSSSDNMQHSELSHFKDVIFDRTVSSTLDVKLPVRKSFDQTFSKAHVANAIALLRSLKS